jgi:hypothetical protein
VLSSTSSSNQRLPAGPWARIWSIALLVAVVILGSCELFWRSRGFRPSVTDDGNLWCLARAKVKPDDPRQFVIIGGSRAQLGIDPAVFGQGFDGRPAVQLAVDGSSCLPVLRDLADDPTFRGIILCDVTPGPFFHGINVNANPQAEYVEQFNKQTFAGRFEYRLRAILQMFLVLRLPDVAPTASNLQAWLSDGVLPQPSNIAVKMDRSKPTDFSRMELPREIAFRNSRERLLPPGLPPDRLSADMDLLNSMVQKIESRHGKVIFILMPVSGFVRQQEEALYPRTLYWDVLASRTKTLTINFTDYPSLAAFTCPEGSHLDAHDMAPFTRALATIIKEKLAQNDLSRAD